MGKTIRVDSEKLVRAIEDGADCLVVGARRFRLVEVDEHDESDQYYDVTDPDEIKLVREVLQDDDPPLRGQAARDYLNAKLKEYGVD